MNNNIEKNIGTSGPTQIPDEMKNETRWVCHNSRKEPINAITGGLASSTNKNSWSSFVDACGGMKTFNLPGIGFMLGDGYVGVDIDGCVEDGEIAPSAMEVIERFQSYTEYSPSGTGIHIICKGSKLGELCKVKTLPGSKALELYDKNRYFTVTGNVIKASGVAGRSKEINWLYEKYFESSKEKKPKPDPKTRASLIGGDENLSCLSRGFERDKKLKAFYEGEFSTNDESAKDLALMGKLLYWTNNDDALAVETFMDSPFVTGKDDKHQEKLLRNDYLLRTIEAARPFSTAIMDQQQYFHRNLASEAPKGMDKLLEMKPHEKYSLDDRGNGDLFADYFKDTARFNATAGEWYIYTGRVWKKDNNAMRVSRKAKELKDLLFPYCLTIRDDKERQQYLKHVGKLGSRAVRDTMLKDARDKYCFENESLDMNLDLLNCLNGTLNIKTMEFREHRGEDLISRIAKVNYIPEARSELWEKFIDEVMQGDAEKIRYLKKAIGYGITADTSLETSYILYGASTRNGKSTLMETLMHLLGGSSGYSLQMKPETLAQKNNNDSRVASGDIARLNGARLLNVSEPPKKMIFDVALLKTLLGRDSIVARHLHEREFEFTPVFKLFMNTNYLPIINDDTLFASGRINVISFDRQFSEEEQDKTLKDRLKENANLSGILNWCIDGLAAFRKEGMKQPESVKEATREYRQESDKLGKFMSECLAISNGNLQASALYTVYENWCKACGYGCENQGNFYAELRTKDLMSKSGTVDGKTQLRVVKGYSILPEWRRYPADPF